MILFGAVFTGFIVGSLYILTNGTQIFTERIDIVIRIVLAIVWCGLIGYSVYTN